MTDKDLDFSGFQTERKVDVPPPPRQKSKPPKKKKKPTKKATSKKKASSTKAESPKKGKKGKERAEEERSVSVESAVAAPEGTKEPPTTRPVARPHRKKRVNVSLPVELSRRFTEKADEEDRYLTDMVLESYRNHYSGLFDEVEEEQGDSDLPLRPRRRKAATGRVTHMLYLAAPELAVLDGSAHEIGLTRSEFVAHLLDRELQ